MNRPKKKTCDARRAHLRTTAMRRGGMPLPGSFDFVFLGAVDAGDFVAVAVAVNVNGDVNVDVNEGVVVDVDVDVDVVVDGDGDVDGFCELSDGPSSDATGPGLPVTHGIGSGCVCWVTAQTSFTRRLSQRAVPRPRFSPIAR
jgi:hypothetical protein